MPVCSDTALIERSIVASGVVWWLADRRLPPSGRFGSKLPAVAISTWPIIAPRRRPFCLQRDQRPAVMNFLSHEKVSAVCFEIIKIARRALASRTTGARASVC
jgi:hypothetical protein